MTESSVTPIKLTPDEAKARFGRGFYRGRKATAPVERVRQLHAEGLGPTAIAKELGLSRMHVCPLTRDGRNRRESEARGGAPLSTRLPVDGRPAPVAAPGQLRQHNGMQHREVAQPIASAPHGGTMIEVRTVEDGTWQEARWMAGNLALIDGERATAGFWEKLSPALGGCARAKLTLGGRASHMP